MDIRAYLGPELFLNQPLRFIAPCWPNNVMQVFGSSTLASFFQIRGPAHLGEWRWSFWSFLDLDAASITKLQRHTYHLMKATPTCRQMLKKYIKTPFVHVQTAHWATKKWFDTKLKAPIFSPSSKTRHRGGPDPVLVQFLNRLETRGADQNHRNLDQTKKTFQPAANPSVSHLTIQGVEMAAGTSTFPIIHHLLLLNTPPTSLQGQGKIIYPLRC